MAIDKKKLRDFAGKKKPMNYKPSDEEDEDLGEEMTVEEIVEEVEAEYEAGGLDDEMELAEGYEPDDEGNPPQWVEDEAIWTRAKKAVEDKMDKYDKPWAVICAIYSRMGGSFK